MAVEAGSRKEVKIGPSRDTKRHGSGLTKIGYIQRHVYHGFHATRYTKLHRSANSTNLKSTLTYEDI